MSYLLYSQMDINTSNPQGVFNVDGGKDNTALGLPTIAQQTNDIIFSKEGKLGIDITKPHKNSSVHIKHYQNLMIKQNYHNLIYYNLINIMTIQVWRE
ncbi:hypothetical protein PFY10_20055 [Chryseobacterium daecheongense]|nr:hypothetical protein PFY10_20055 [Chryseobacterium daecheongense]